MATRSGGRSRSGRCWRAVWAIGLTLTGCSAERQAGERANEPVRLWTANIAAESLQSQLPDFVRQYPAVRVQLDMAGSNMSRARFLLALSAGVGAPDIYQIEIGYVARYAATGQLCDLTERAAPYADQFTRACWENCLWDGRVYAIPWDAGPCLIYYKKSVLDKYGIDAGTIRTWDDYLAAGERIRDASAGKTRMLPLATGEMFHFFEMLLQQRGGQIFDEQGRVVIDSTATRETLDLIRRILQSDISLNISPFGHEMFASFSSEDIATYPNASWFGGFVKKYTAEKMADELQWRALPLPAHRGQVVRSSNRGGSVLVIPRQSQKQDAAWSLIEFTLCRSENQLAHYRKFNLFPAFLPAQQGPEFDQPEPFFGGQRFSQRLADDFALVPSLHRTTDWAQVERYMNQALSAWVNDGMSDKDFLSRVAHKIARRTGRIVAVENNNVALTMD